MFEAAVVMALAFILNSETFGKNTFLNKQQKVLLVSSTSFLVTGFLSSLALLLLSQW
jgi:hypothetical protein